MLIPASIAPDADDPTGWKAAEALIGFIKDAPSDMAEHTTTRISVPDRADKRAPRIMVTGMTTA